MMVGRSERFDVVVIGGGLAGLRAALAAAEAGSRTAIVCKSYLAAETASGMAGGGYVYPSSELPPEEYLAEVMRTGRGLNDRRLLEHMARDGEADFHDAVRRFGWKFIVRDRFQSTLRDGVVPGYRTALTVARAAVQAGAVPFENHVVTKLIVINGRCRGCVCLDRSGAPVVLQAGAVVLATGGYAGIYSLHDNPQRSTGDGHLLAVEAGCRLRDLEFVQFYPLGLSDPKLPHYMMGLPFPAGSRLLDENGDDVLERHFPAGTDMYAAAKNYRDALSIAILQEREQGHCPQADFSRTDPAVWEQFSITRLLPLWGRDPAAAPVPVSPIAHFTMGGVVIDESLETDVKALFAAGEVAGGVHGANRYAANALLGCLVHGRIAGEAASRTAADVPATSGSGDSSAWTSGGYLTGASTGSASTALPSEESLRRQRNQLNHICGRHLSPLRSASGLKAGLQAIGELSDSTRALRAEGPAARSTVELRSGILLAGWSMQAALLREESRGAHFRADYPHSDDDNWLRPILVRPLANEGDAGRSEDMPVAFEMGAHSLRG